MYKIAVLFALGALQAGQANAAGDVVAGKRAFSQCASCHQIGPTARGSFGPQLNAIIGRPAGSTVDYRYSAAMKAAGIVWTEKNLTAFIKAPSDVVPGTKMRLWGFSDDQKITDLLAYLRSVQ